jgi:hypothetical protein
MQPNKQPFKDAMHLVTALQIDCRRRLSATGYTALKVGGVLGGKTPRTLTKLLALGFTPVPLNEMWAYINYF